MLIVGSIQKGLSPLHNLNLKQTALRLTFPRDTKLHPTDALTCVQRRILLCLGAWYKRGRPFCINIVHYRVAIASSLVFHCVYGNTSY